MTALSVTYYSASRTLNYIPPGKIPAFLKLVDIVAAAEGSDDAACKALGIPRGTVWNARHRTQMTERVARDILLKYKQWKAKR